MNLNNGVLDGIRRIGGRFRDVTVDGGLPGAPLGLRLRGATASGPPATGTWKAGDQVSDRTGAIWICTAAGSPGSWCIPGGLASYLPGDQDLLSASDPGPYQFSAGFTAGALYLTRVPVRYPLTATYLWLMCNSSGTGDSGSYVGLYSSSGTLLTGSSGIGNVPNNVAASGNAKFAFTTPQALTPPWVWGAMLLVGQTPHVAYGPVGAYSGNLGLTAATYRYATNGSGLSTLPPTITPASNSPVQGPWMGIS